MNIQKKNGKFWDKPVVNMLSIKNHTMHGTSYAPNESIGSDKYSPAQKNSIQSIDS